MEKRVTAAGIPVFAFTAYSGTGKTTFLEKLIACMCDRKKRVAIIKHDAHKYDLYLDSEGKDSWRFARAGAVCVGLSNDEQAAIFEYRSNSPEEMLSKIENVDVIFLEGYHDLGYPTFSLAREGTGQGHRIPYEKAFALISDMKAEATCQDKMWFDLEDAEAVAEFLCTLV